MSESDNEDTTFIPIKHWGEIPDTSSRGSNYMFPDISEVISNSMQKDCLNMYPDDEDIMQIKDIILPSLDPLVMYAIQLHKWMNNMSEIINLVEIAMENNLTPPQDAKVPIPDMPDVTLRHRKNNLNFMPTKLSEESGETELEIPDLSESVVKALLGKCVAVMTAHIGFKDSFQSVLDTLVDVLGQFFENICDRFVSALSEEETLDSGGFPNALERVLVEMGMGGARGLHDYYQCRVIKYVTVLQRRCNELEQHYTRLSVPRSETSTRESVK